MRTPSKLVTPDGSALGFYTLQEPRELTRGEVLSLNDRFLRTRENFEAFHGMVTEKRLLDEVLQLTSHQGFMDSSLERVQRDVQIRNMLAGMLHTEHTHFSSHVTYLPWMSIFSDYFTRIPIPENKAAVAEGAASVGALSGLSDRDFYDTIKQGILIPTIDGTTLKVEGLELRVLSNEAGTGSFVTPINVEASSKKIEVDGKVFYNGLPGDRSAYPTLLLPEDSQLIINIKNTTPDKAYMIMPTINGIPFRISRLGIWSNGFATSALPVTFMEPEKIYLRPGEDIKLNRFFANSVVVSDQEKDVSYASGIDERAEKASFLSAAAARLLRAQMTNAEGALLNSSEYDPDLRAQILFESQMRYVRAFAKDLNKTARETPIYMRRPVLARSKGSTELDNPFLGSLGLAVVEVSKPPVRDLHTYHHSRLDLSGGTRSLTMGVTRGAGIAGLAQIGGGVDHVTARTDHTNNWDFGSDIHTFRGYAPLNLMSTSGKMSVVKG